MYIYYCWITVLTPVYQDKIIAGLVGKGYMVGPASKDGKVLSSGEESASALISLGVYRPEETDVGKIYDDLIAVLVEMEAFYYSIVVSLSTEATWTGSNIVMPKQETPKPPPLPSAKKNMN